MNQTTREAFVAELEEAPAVDTTDNDDGMVEMGEKERKAAKLIGWGSAHVGEVLEGLEALDGVLANPPKKADSGGKFRMSLIERVLGALRALRLELSALVRDEQLDGTEINPQIEGLRNMGTRLSRRHPTTSALMVTRGDVSAVNKGVGQLIDVLKGLLHSTAVALLKVEVVCDEPVECIEQDHGSDGSVVVVNVERAPEEDKKKKEKEAGRRVRRGHERRFGVSAGGGYWTEDSGEESEPRPHIAYANRSTGDGEQDEKGGEGGEDVKADATVDGVNDGDDVQSVATVKGVNDGKVALPLLACGATTCHGCALAGKCADQPTTTSGPVDA
jgi:hypothetical protein